MVMTIVGKRVKSREKAVEIVNNFTANFTESNSDKIYEDGNFNFEYIAQMAWSMGVGGWYYDEVCTKFCTDVIIEHIIKTKHGELVIETTNWMEDQA